MGGEERGREGGAGEGGDKEERGKSSAAERCGCPTVG